MTLKVSNSTPDNFVGKKNYESPAIKFYQMEIEGTILDGSGSATSSSFEESSDRDW